MQDRLAGLRGPSDAKVPLGPIVFGDRLWPARLRVPTGTWALALPSGRAIWSEMALRVFGVSRALLRAKPGGGPQVGPSGGRRVVEPRHHEVGLRAARSFVIAYRILRPDGSCRLLQFQGVPRMGTHAALAVDGTAVDITEAARWARDAERRSAQRELILDATTAAMVGIGDDGEITFCNVLMKSLFGPEQRADRLGRRRHRPGARDAEGP